ncbi:aspartic peptidase [Gramella lutea]|uniref:Aspartic peptidase n=1 Tax=Christiangramia lutea TaxID=1607951 RepID=A0A9X1V4Q2_9FLAO|nr:aspartic peptidase [Christiangramia lutea]MCH4823611.1 aspartic peptidase [Christiangramia lutea]
MNKHLFFLILFACFSIICNSQINQFDSEGRRNGPWKVNFEGTSKPKFEGTFDHGKEIGTFKFYKKGFYDHPSAIMNFENGKDSVHVTYYTQKGKEISEGKMIDKKREGKWIYYHQESDSIMMLEEYKNDKLHGSQKTYYPNGQIAENTEYSIGEKHGKSLIYANNGQITKDLSYMEGQLHGPAIYYNVNGEKIMEGGYSNGSKSGTWKYYEQGKLKNEEDY